MHDDHRRAGLHLAVDEPGERRVIVVLVHAQPAFHRDRDVHRGDHRRHALAHQFRLAHQAGAEAPGLHPVGRAAAIEVDLVVTPVRGDVRGLRQQRRVTAAQLQCQRMLAGVETEQPLAVAVDDRIGVNHLGIQPRTGREDAVEHPAMGVRPVHHRRDGQAQGGGMARVVVRLQNGLFRTLDRLHLRPGGGAGDVKGKRSA